jgi:gliding motility-associated-like protein
MIKKILFGLSLILLTGRLPVFGQRENSNWYFGINAALNFPTTGAPTAVAGSAMNTYEATTTVSDGNGQLLFYSNSENIWNRNNQIMVNGATVGGHQSASQGTIAVQNPANAQQYYVFVVDGAENQLVGGLKYNLVDMTRQGGLGEVISRRVQVSSVPLTEKMTTVPHPNGRDTWVLVHGWLTNTFYAYLLTPGGLQATPVVTSIGSVHSGGGGNYGNANSVGYMRVSPNGSKLAVGIRDSQFELFDFNPATGRLSNYIQLDYTYRSYGVAFSPDSRLLYGTNLNYYEVYQFDLQAGSASAIASSGIVIANTADNSGGLQLGPDGKLYVSIYNSSYLAVINNPNVRGIGCGFQANAVYLGGKLAQIGLPNFPASRVAPPTTVTTAFTAAPSCAGSAVAFTGTTTPTLSNTVASWNFGDPASGSANTATGLTPTHTYTTAGTYQVTLTVTGASLAAPAISTQSVTVAPLPSVRLGADTLVCPNAVWTLRPSPQPVGTFYRWQDGSTGATYVAHGPGQYSVEVRATATSCSATATLLASPKDCPILIPNVITPNGDPQNEFFVLKGLTPSDWRLRVFDRWGRQVYDQAKYDNGWNAMGQSAGLYFYLLSNPATGERHQGWVEVVRGS